MSATLSNGTAVSYSYDGRGNRLSGSGAAVAYTVNDNNQLTSRSVGTSGRGYGVSGKVAPGAQVKVFHPGAPQGEVLTANPSTGVYEQWWGDPGAGVTRVELLVRGTKAGAGESGRDAVADKKVWVNLPLSSESYIYDGAGRLTEDGTWWYNWNALGQLTSLWRKPNAAPDPNVNTESITYGYDSDGRRTGRTRTVTYFDSTPALTETSKVLWEKWHPVMEERLLNGSALPRRWFVWGRDVSGTIGGAGGIGGLVSIKEEGGRTLLPMDDGLGNIIAVVDASSRAIIARYDYGPFGEIVSESGEVGSCPFRFQSKWWDAAAGLNYFGYRHYHPKMGRWLSRDPLGEAGGFNLYAYCGNDPVNKWDYLGMDPVLRPVNAAEAASVAMALQRMVEEYKGLEARKLQNNAILSRQTLSLSLASLGKEITYDFDTKLKVLEADIQWHKGVLEEYLQSAGANGIAPNGEWARQVEVKRHFGLYPPFDPGMHETTFEILEAASLATGAKQLLSHSAGTLEIFFAKYGVRSRAAKNLNSQLWYLDEYMRTFEGQYLDDILKFLESKGIRAMPGAQTSYLTSTNKILFESGATRRWELLEEWLHWRVANQGWMRAEIDSLAQTIPKQIRKPFSRRWVDTKRYDAAEEITIKRFILDNFKRHLDEKDIGFLENQIEQMRRFGEAFSH